MNEVVSVRDVEIIAAEINNIKNQTRIMVLNNSIEIGRRLVEAKSIVEHGKWGSWLEEKVNYSQRTAQNLMKIFNEYSSNQISLFGDTNTQAFANLSYSQAVALLAIPDLEQREAFVVENKVEDMSTRELQQAIKDLERVEKEREEAIKLAEELRIKTKQMDHDKANLESEIRIKEESLKISKENIDKLHDTLEREREGTKLELNKLNETIKIINSELEEARESEDEERVLNLQEELNKKQSQEAGYMQKIQELEEKLKDKPIEIEVVEKTPTEVEEELKKLRERVSISDLTSKFKVNFDMVVNSFNELFEVIDNMPEELKEKYKNALKTLIAKMNERL